LFGGVVDGEDDVFDVCGYDDDDWVLYECEVEVLVVLFVVFLIGDEYVISDGCV